jgi:hypothetical protein
MSKRKLARLVKQLADQPGVRVRPTGGNGWFFYLPNGKTACLHQTQSDRHSMANFRAIIRNAGVEYPDGK